MKGKNQRSQWLNFFIIVALFILFLGGLYLRLISVRSDAAKTEKTVIKKPVKVIPLQRTERWIYRDVLGRIEGGQTVKIRADVGGWVEEIRVTRGQEVKKGELIVKLFDERKKVELDEVLFRFNSGKSNLKETRRKYNQSKELFEKGIIAKDTLDSLYNRMESEEANLKSLEASYNRIKWNYDNLEIKSPINGKIIDIIPDIGQEVLVRELVAEVVNLTSKKIVAGVDASIARLAKKVENVEVNLRVNGHEESTMGKIVGISQNTNDLSGTYDIEVRITDENVDWWPGEIVSIKIPIKKMNNIIKFSLISII